MPSLALIAIAAIVAWPLAIPTATDANAYFFAGPSADGESIRVNGTEGLAAREEGWSTSRGFFAAPASGVPTPGTSQMIAYDLVIQRGLSDSEFDCLNALWKKESGWNHFAQNRSSGAYGIPQALPGSKMASAGADWATNPETQIRWGLGYIEGRYGTPCAAWEHSQRKGWY